MIQPAGRRVGGVEGRGIERGWLEEESGGRGKERKEE